MGKLSLQKVSNKAGVYIFRSKFGKVIYVGKAKCLKKRMSSYLNPSRSKTADPKLRSLIHSIASFDTIEVKNEQEALILEAKLIKKYIPRYNIELRDDKRFFLVKIDINSPFPKLTLTRLKKDDHCIYFGPFPHSPVLKEMLLFFSKTYGIKTCHAINPGEKERKHCLDHIVRNCSAPCENKISEEEYKENIEKVSSIFKGKNKEIIEKLTIKMKEYSKKHQFEKAAKLRDMIRNIKSITGTINRSFERTLIRKEHNRVDALNALKNTFEMNKIPESIECIDNSNIAGEMAVSSMVCFKNGKPSNKDYRHFKIKTVTGIDDFAMMYEIVTRRYKRLLNEQKKLPDIILVDGGKGQLTVAEMALNKLNIQYKIFNDNITKNTRDSLILAGLAKRNEEIFVPGKKQAIILPKDSSELHLLQYIRDEAHRFAITFHRKYRDAAITNSLLDEIPGIGEKRKKLILQTFGSVTRLRKVSSEEIIKKIPGIGRNIANLIVKTFS